MANFKVRPDGTFGNSEGCGYGCCWNCKYHIGTEKWLACSEMCRRKYYGSCLDCDHRPSYMLRQEEAFYQAPAESEAAVEEE